MITPKEIRDVCNKWWKEILISFSNSTRYFPKEISRIGRVNSKDILINLADYMESIQLLIDNSNEKKKNSYKLILEERNFDKIGRQEIPYKIIIENIDDYLWITRKEKDFELFKKNHSLIVQEIPLLHDWIKSNPTWLIEHDTWGDTLKVCEYFLENPKSELYIRQLPIDIHTKYIQENKVVIQSLLEFLIPDHLNSEETKFELRFNLKYAEPLIRIRFLDKSLSPLNNVTDISLTVSEFEAFQVNCDSIFVAENIMNFLTLPYLSKTIAIWSGGGFGVSHLKDIHWIKGKQFFYWGDLDAHGFQILNQFRTYFPDTIAVLMDEETLSNFPITKGQNATNQNLTRLTVDEAILYNHLRQNTIRLEQEKINQTYAEERIKNLVRRHQGNKAIGLLKTI